MALDKRKHCNPNHLKIHTRMVESMICAQGWHINRVFWNPDKLGFNVLYKFDFICILYYALWMGVNRILKHHIFNISKL